jgi:hypothetical protein
MPRTTEVASKPWQTPERHDATGEPRKETESPSAIRSGLYLPESVYEALRKIAFDEPLKIHDVVPEGIDAVPRQRGYPSIENLKAGRTR